MGACTGKNKSSVKVIDSSPQIIEHPCAKEPAEETPKMQVDSLKMKLNADYLKNFNPYTTDHFCYLTKKWFQEWSEFCKSGKTPSPINSIPYIHENELMYISRKDWQFLINQFSYKYQIISKDNKIQCIESKREPIKISSVTPISTPSKEKPINCNALGKPISQYYSTSLKKPQNNFISPNTNEPQSPKSNNSKYNINQCIRISKHQ